MSAPAGSLEVANSVEIDWYDEREQVVVVPRNQRRFAIQKDRAIEALRLASKAEKQFDLLLETLASWIKERVASISVAIVTLHDNSLAFVVVQRSPSYDEQFQDDLAELDFAIAQDPDLDSITLRTVLLPPVEADALGSFLDQRMILTYQHGQRA